MSMELTILGIRKLRSDEIKELNGKTAAEIEKSGFFRQLYPSAPYHSKYNCYWEISESMNNIRDMFTRITDADDDPVYVFWSEVLGYYWKNLSHDDPRIDEFLEAARGYIDWDREFQVVPSGLIGSWLTSGPVAEQDGEIVVFIYG